MQGETKKVKVQLELRLASDLSDNKKCFLSMLITRGRLKKTLDHYLLKIVSWLTRDEEKVKAFNVAFASMFNNRPGAYQCPESVDPPVQELWISIFGHWSCKGPAV